MAIDHHAAFVGIAIGTGCQLQVFLYIVFEKFADIAGVVEVAVFKAAGLLWPVVLSKQAVALGHAVALVAVDPRRIVAPAVPVFAPRKAGEVFIRRAITLVLVLARQHQHLVVLAVVVAARVGQRVVDLRVVGIVEHAINVQAFQRVRTLAMLLAVKHPLFKNNALGTIAMVLFKAISRLVIAISEFLLQLFDFAPLVQRSCQIARHFYVHCRQAAVLFDDGVHHLARLVQGSQHHGVAGYVNVIAKDHGAVAAAFVFVERR